MFCNHIAMSENPLVKLLSYILPSEFNEYFDLTDVKEEERGVEKILHLYLHEKNLQPDVSQRFLPGIMHQPLSSQRAPYRSARMPSPLEGRFGQDV